MAGLRRALRLERSAILAFRRRVQHLDARLPPGGDSLAEAAHAGLQDSVPRSALHALHARVERVDPDALDDPALTQVWGPRYTAYVVPSDAHVAFTLARLPTSGRIPERARDLADRLDAYLAGRRLRADAAARGLGMHDTSLRYATLTGRVLIRWDGARQPTVWTTAPPDTTPADALGTLLRRYLHWSGPSTVEAFVRWGGIDRRAAQAAFHAAGSSLVPVRTPLGDASILATDEAAFQEPASPPATARLLPSGDPYYLCWDADRELLVPDPAHAAALWTPRVWPGALLVADEIVGTWRRATAVVEVTPWRPLTADERAAVEAEATGLPLPDGTSPVVVRWTGEGVDPRRPRR